MPAKLLVVVSMLAILATSCSDFIRYDGGIDVLDVAADANIGETGADSLTDTIGAPDGADSSACGFGAPCCPGNVCGAGTVCVAGTCACAASDTLCSGLCSDLSTSTSNCGSCGHRCATGFSCSSGTCACQTGRVVCGASCVNLQSDPANCGTCGIVCAVGTTCSTGVCI